MLKFQVFVAPGCLPYGRKHRPLAGVLAHRNHQAPRQGEWWIQPHFASVGDGQVPAERELTPGYLRSKVADAGR